MRKAKECFRFVNDIISSMFSMGMKTNENLQAAMITGCLQIAKNQIFTGFNNLTVYPVTSAPFSTCFGFTKAEAMDLLSSYHLEDRIGDVKANYDGYLIGGAGYFSISDGCTSNGWRIKSQDVKVNGRTDFTLINYTTNQAIILEEKIARTEDEILAQRREGLRQAKEYGDTYREDGFTVLEYAIVYNNLSAYITKA